jgi:hypothetical protein
MMIGESRSTRSRARLRPESGSAHGITSAGYASAPPPAPTPDGRPATPPLGGVEQGRTSMSPAVSA